MQKPHSLLDQLDVRSLRVLKHVLETKSVSKTADYMRLSQPATSRILAKLRDLTNDPLLVRTEKQFGLTAHAEQLYPKVVAALESIATVVESSEFAISNTFATVRFASTDYGVVSVLSRLYPVLLSEGPGLRLEISNFTPDVFTLIEQSEIDLALYANFELPGEFHYRKLFEENYSILMRKNHPLLLSTDKERKIRAEQLEDWPRIEMLYPAMNMMQNDEVISFDTDTDRADVKVRLPYFFASVSLIETTDTIAALPTRMCKYLQQRYDVVTLDMQDADSFTYVLIWHHRQHQRPLLRWLIEKISAVCEDV